MDGGRNPRNWRGAVGAVAIALVLVAAVVVGVAVVRSGSATEELGRTDSNDPRVQPLAEFVAARRGAPFVEPVEIEFVDDETFGRRILDESKTDEDTAALEADTVELRALGLLGPHDDFSAAFERVLSESLAYYSPTSKSVTVRGKVLDTAHRSTLVHELVHAWQDQHVGLSGLDTFDPTRQETLRMVVEGDATLVMQDWMRDELTAEEREEHARTLTDAVSASQAAFADLPAIAVTSIYTPYLLGPGYTLVLRAEGGNDAVDAALADPPRTQSEVLDPRRSAAGAEVSAVDAPTLPPGAEVLRDGPFGAYSWLVVLSDRMSARSALEAVAGWAGDRAVVFRLDEKECVAATVKGRDDSSGVLLTYALEQWAATRPPGSTTTDRIDGGAVVRSCADGGQADAGTSGLVGANYAGFRLGLAGQLMSSSGTDVDRAMCAATATANQLSPEELESGRVERAIPHALRAIRDCRG